MDLTDIQKDALTELINIGFGRSASALSMLVGQRVVLEAPEVSLYPIGEMETALRHFSNGEITSVHQVFSGRLRGNAMLLLDGPSTFSLVSLLTGREAGPDTMTENDREAMIETGNILLNAFIGSFGNLLKVHVSFAVPSLRLESLKKMVETLLIENEEVEVALVVRVHFWLAKGNVSGYVVLVMGIQSLETLMDAMQAAGFLEQK